MKTIVPQNVPRGFALFYTTSDFRGHLNDAIARELMDVIEREFGVTASLTTCNQVHGVNLAKAQRAPWSECDSCDALYSQAPHTALGIKVADCLPVTIIDPAHSVIANIHSGWRGAAQNITSQTIDTLERETAFDAAQSRAWLGPSIRVCCFEVGEEVASQFDERFVDRSHAKPHVDIPAFTNDILIARGFAADAITDTQLCTRCEGSIFHSYRRGANGGRNLAIVAQ